MPIEVGGTQVCGVLHLWDGGISLEKSDEFGGISSLASGTSACVEYGSCKGIAAMAMLSNSRFVLQKSGLGASKTSDSCISKFGLNLIKYQCLLHCYLSSVSTR